MAEQAKEKTKKTKKLTKIEKLKKEIKDLQKQNEEYLDKLLRFKAEFENYKKRMIKEQSRAINYASETIIHRLLPIVDDLDRALAATESEQDAQKIIDGVKLTHKDIKNLLEEHSVCEINPLGEPFNPEQHEAVFTQDSDKHDENCVIQVIQKGYTLNGKIVRPAKVAICKRDKS